MGTDTLFEMPSWRTPRMSMSFIKHGSPREVFKGLEKGD
jgi:hypothetical protein